MLDTLVCMFSTYCAVPFTVESVDVVSPTGETVAYPELAYRNERISPSTANSYIGIKYFHKILMNFAIINQIIIKVNLQKQLQNH